LQLKVVKGTTLVTGTVDGLYSSTTLRKWPDTLNFSIFLFITQKQRVAGW